MKVFSYEIICFLVFFSAIAFAEPIKYLEQKGIRIIEGQVFNTTLIIDGSKWDNAIIRNNHFKNQEEFGILLSNANNVLIENNTFSGMKRNAIKLKSRQKTGTNNILIKNNLFQNIPVTAILVGEPNQNVQIFNNRFHNVAYDTSGNKQHALYLKGRDAYVKGNYIEGVIAGNGISIRASGYVTGNSVSKGTQDGIKYYSSTAHKGGSLIIENNVIYDNQHGGIVVKDGKGAKVDNIVIRFNTLVNNDRALRLYKGMNAIDIAIYANLLIEKTGKFSHFETTADLIEHNKKSTSYDVITDYAQQDFHPVGEAFVKLSEKMALPSPAKDIEGHEFSLQAPYYAGAYQTSN